MTSDGCPPPFLDVRPGLGWLLSALLSEAKYRNLSCPTGYDPRVTEEKASRSGSPASSGCSTAEVLQWVGSVVAEGIVGGLTWEILKSNVVRFRTRRSKASGNLNNRELLRYIACRAVIDQCKAHGLPAPDIRRLEVNSSKLVELNGERVYELTVTSTFDSPFSARVHIPVEDLEHKLVQVTIYRAITWDVLPESKVAST